MFMQYTNSGVGKTKCAEEIQLAIGTFQFQYSVQVPVLGLVELN